MTAANNEVRMVRVYITEGDHKLKSLLSRLHDEEQVRGVTVFRGIAGFGKSGKLHSSALLDLANDLPLIVEFFDTPEKVERIVSHLKEELEPGHIVSWSASVD